MAHERRSQRGSGPAPGRVAGAVRTPPGPAVARTPRRGQGRGAAARASGRGARIVTCSSCGTENREGARFCRACGAALA
ncbi:MAG TPA: hypothetical protein DIU14_08250, partial [Actinobacteria bacterium]|nr:hypothetical protein [Actinomycetota bacterium]